MKLVLGVIDIPYSDYHNDPANSKKKSYGKGKRGKAGKRKASAPQKPFTGTQSTGSVAKQLEDRYKIMDRFYKIHEKDIKAALTKSYAGAIKNIKLGAPLDKLNPSASAMDKIQRMFKQFLSGRELEYLGIKGIPTMAAQLGVSHRFKNNRGPMHRPSFIDTGLYQSSFKAWMSK